MKQPMKKIMKKMKFYPFFLLLLTAYSCGGNAAENSLEEELNEEPDVTVNEVSEEEIFNLIETFPTPIEIAMVMKNGNYDFSSEMLLAADSVDRFTTSYDKAMAMGSYSTDMGYLNIYDKVFLLVDHLTTIRSLAKDLDLDSFFDFEKMLDMSENSDNIDSLIQMSTESFNGMEEHLREQGRDEISLLIVFGTWLENAYVMSEIAKSSQDEKMYDRVAEQKDFVKELNNIFKSSSDKFFQKLGTDLAPLEELYDQVEIEFIMKEPTMEEVDGQLVFIDNSETVIKADDGVIDKIIETTLKLRNELLNK